MKERVCYSTIKSERNSMAERILDEGNRTLLLSVGKPTGEYRYQYTKVMDVLT